MENEQNNGRPPQVEDILKRLKEVKTTPELDAMRKEIVRAIHAAGTEEAFHQLQDAFREAQYRLTMMEHPAGRAFLERVSALEEQVQQLTKERGGLRDVFGVMEHEMEVFCDVNCTATDTAGALSSALSMMDYWRQVITVRLTDRAGPCPSPPSLSPGRVRSASS